MLVDYDDFLATSAPIGSPWYADMSIGQKGLVYAEKALALTMVDLFQNGQILRDMHTGFLEIKGDHQPKAIIPNGPPPVLTE